MSAVILGDLAKLDRASQKMKAVADHQLHAEMRKALSGAAKDEKANIKALEADKLPKGHGKTKKKSKSAAQRYAARPTITLRTGGGDVTVRIRNKKSGHDLAAINRGVLRHPLFGNRKYWYNSSIPSGYFDRTMVEVAPALREKFGNVLGDAIERFVSNG